MGQKHVRDPFEQRWMLFFHPEQLGNGIARRYDHAEVLKRPTFAAQPIEQALIFVR